MLFTFLVAQVATPPPNNITEQAVNNIPSHTASLINLSTILLIGPMLLFLCVIIWLVLNSPAATPILEGLAQFWEKRNKPLKAALVYEKLYDFNELLGAEHYARLTGQAYEHAGKTMEAIKWYRKAREWSKIGQLYQEVGMTDQAIKAYREGRLFARVAMCYETDQNFISAGLTYENQLQNPHKAKKYYEKTIKQSTSPQIERVKAHLLLSRIHLKMGKKAQAIEHYKEVELSLSDLSKEPEFQIVIQFIQYNLANHI